MLIKFNKIKKDFGDVSVLKDINLEIERGERVGLVGGNGAGKTTLANIIFGNLICDAGEIIWGEEDLKVGYLIQSTYYTSNTINNMFQDTKEVIKGFFERASQLGLKNVKSWDNTRFDGLSGGEKTKLALAHIWAEKPNLLILDEPTNHMDFQGIQWLIDEINKYKGTIIIISHDRYFLDECVGRIIELENGVIHSYKGNYTFYRNEKKRQYDSQLNAYSIQEKYKQKIAQDIHQLKNWSDKSHRESRKKAKQVVGKKEYFRVKAKKKDKQVKSKLKRLEKIELEGVKKPKAETKINFEFDGVEKKGKRMIEAINISKAYGEHVLFKNSSFYIQRGDRIGLFGRNGCGKSTLIKAVMGEESLDDGKMSISASAKIAYLSQDVLELNEEKTVLDVFDIVSKEKLSKARTLLSNMGFTQLMINKQIKQLSLGERTRIKIAQLILNENTMLILDEPTNHLDLRSREKLEETLEAYNGTILIASHDRYMLERICDKLLVFENGSIKRKEYGFKEYMDSNQKTDQYHQNKEEEKLILENRISYILGQLSQYSPQHPEYQKLDAEFNALMKKKNMPL
ncbi:MAG: ABC-F type ribosomal protection protein [Clostridia bacterium]|nr:ABC-F type ribosomal protection protein [Clostridia bacterium]